MYPSATFLQIAFSWQLNLNLEHFPGKAGVSDTFFFFSCLFLRAGLVDVLPMDMAIICSSMEPLGGAKIAL